MSSYERSKELYINSPSSPFSPSKKRKRKLKDGDNAKGNVDIDQCSTPTEKKIKENMEWSLLDKSEIPARLCQFMC